MSEGKLPQGWRWARLRSLGEFVSGGTPAKANTEFWGKQFPFVTGADITDVRVSRRNARAFLTEEGLFRGKTAICQPDTVLIVSRTRVGRAGVATELMGASQDITGLICNEHAYPQYVARYLVHRADYLIENARGSTIMGLTRDFVENIEIPLPPLAEQRRIVAVLEEKLAAVEQARQAARAQLDAARALPAAYLRGVFEGEEAGDWEIRRIGDLARVQSGYAFKSEWFSADGIKLLRNVNVRQNYIDWSDAVRLPMSDSIKFRDYELSEGDIVLSLDRPLVSSGLKVARVSKEDLPSLLLQRVGRFQVQSNEVEPDFLFLFLNSAVFIQAISGHDYSLGVPHISPKQVESVELPLPPRDLQRQIMHMLTAHAQQSQALINLLRDQLIQIEGLAPTLLRQAFLGELL